jgi:hypothetical protein
VVARHSSRALVLDAKEGRQVTTLVSQPDGSKLCAHCCVAMVLGITLEEAIKRVGHRRGTRNHELVRALGVTGKFLPSRDVTDPSIIRIKGPKSRHHVALLAGGKVYDPDYAKPAPSFDEWVRFVEGGLGWRIVSHLKLDRAIASEAKREGVAT